MPRKRPDVLDEPEDRKRLWAAVEKEINFRVFYMDRQFIWDAIAHALAEQQRTHFGVGGAPAVRAHCDPDCDFCQGVSSAADLIDPKAER